MCLSKSSAVNQSVVKFKLKRFRAHLTMPNTPNCIPDAPQMSRDDLCRVIRVDLADLLSAGFIDGGTTIYPRSEKFAESSATINSGGTIELNGLIIDSLSAAAKQLTGRPTNG